MAVACYFAPILLAVIGALLLLLVIARLLYRGRDRYIPNLYARDISVYDDKYRGFILRSLAELRQRKIAGHTLLWEAEQIKSQPDLNSTELLLDLGVWLGWSTRLMSEASGRKVYGFDTFTGLVEDWQIDDQMVLKSGTFSLTEPLAQRLMPATGVTLDDDGVPPALGRNVEFIKGMTYDTLAPFLAERPGAPIRLFHMDLDTYESCLHALETCKDRFVEGSILVFDEYLVTNAEMQAFYEFQDRYKLEWQYRSWGLEIWEMNVEMVHRAVAAAALLLHRDGHLLAARQRQLRLGVLHQAVLEILAGCPTGRHRVHARRRRTTKVHQPRDHRPG